MATKLSIKVDVTQDGCISILSVHQTDSTSSGLGVDRMSEHCISGNTVSVDSKNTASPETGVDIRKMFKFIDQFRRLADRHEAAECYHRKRGCIIVSERHLGIKRTYRECANRIESIIESMTTR